MWTRRKLAISESQRDAEHAIAAALGGGDSLPAWNAVWDLVQSTDSHAKQDVLAALRSYITSSTTGDQMAVARTFESAIERSLSTPPLRQQLLPSREVRDQHQQDQVEASRQAMRDIGVRPGEGLPMWSMYMTRRSKRTWGS